MFHVVFHRPLIPPNTGNAIRMVACTGATLHLIEPLGFDLSDAQLRRSGLDYHDLARLQVHPDLETAFEAIGSTRVFAFTPAAETPFADISYEAGDVLLFGTETTGLPTVVMSDKRITALVGIPMVPGPRSMNLSNSAAIATYEAWRQHGFAGAL